MGQRQPNSLRKGRPKRQDGVFLTPRGAGPTTTPRKQVGIIVRMLLIMGGIERNPGPQWPCTICTKETLHSCIQCVVCERWTHFTCAKLDGNRLQYAWSCRSCTEKENYDMNLRIMQFNCNGLRNKIEERVLYMKKVGCKIGLFQETFLKPNSNLKVPKYSIIRKDRSKDKGGGIAIIIHNSITYSNVSVHCDDDFTEAQCIKVKFGNEIKLFNIYIPPASSCAKAFQPNLEPFMVEHSIICGDLNGHRKLWHSAIEEDQRGAILTQQIDAASMVFLNENAPTRIPSQGRCSSPDVTISHPNLAKSTEWLVDTVLISNHNPIIVRVSLESKRTTTEMRTFVNFLKVDWLAFKGFVENRIPLLPVGDVLNMELALRKLLQAAARKHISKGRIPSILTGFPTEAEKLTRQRDDLRRANPSNPRVTELNQEIQKKVQKHRQDKWIQHLEECDLRKGCKKLWRTIKGLSGKAVYI